MRGNNSMHKNLRDRPVPDSVPAQINLGCFDRHRWKPYPACLSNVHA